jgi:glycosyltransferase involved in cell wall biosynthesis
MQVLVTSYRRLAYLKQTVKSLRQDDVELYIIDGGSDKETVEWIKQNADGWLLFQNNPGADFLKTEGIQRFATEREFILTSDDLLFPAGYSRRIMENYLAVNTRYPKIHWTFCACQMEHQGISEWEVVNGIECRPAKTSQVAGAIIDTDICRRVGYFPNYGRGGHGDFAFNLRLERLGIRRCFWKDPRLVHIGGRKAIDYPRLHQSYIADKRAHMSHGRADDLVLTDPGPQTPEAGLR